MEVQEVGDNQNEGGMRLCVAFRNNRKRKEAFTIQGICGTYALSHNDHFNQNPLMKNSESISHL